MNEFKLARIRAGLSQQDVARATGVSESKITRIETGRQMPKAKLRQRLAELLHCAPGVLFSNDTSVTGGRRG